MTCPHCGDQTMSAGATGLDLCTRCGGLSRDGPPLPRNRGYQTFSQPSMRDVPLVLAHGVLVQAGLIEGAPAILVVYVMGDGRQLPARSPSPASRPRRSRSSSPTPGPAPSGARTSRNLTALSTGNR